MVTSRRVSHNKRTTTVVPACQTTQLDKTGALSHVAALSEKMQRFEKVERMRPQNPGAPRCRGTSSSMHHQKASDKWLSVAIFLCKKGRLCDPKQKFIAWPKGGSNEPSPGCLSLRLQR
jgi:hypothetical protein